VILTKLRFENQKATKPKKQALWFCLLFDLFVTQTYESSNFLIGVDSLLKKSN
jgi:hypothetical protein